MRIKTGVQILGVTLLLSGCVGVVPLGETETVRIDVTGPSLQGNQQEADRRCAKYDEQRALLKSSGIDRPGVRHDVFECVDPGSNANTRGW